METEEENQLFQINEKPKNLSQKEKKQGENRS